MKPTLRIDTIKENNKKLTKDFNLMNPHQLEQAKLSVLTDISETLAIYTDLMCAVYGRMFALADDNEGGKGNG